MYKMVNCSITLLIILYICLAGYKCRLYLIVYLFIHSSDSLLTSLRIDNGGNVDKSKEKGIRRQVLTEKFRTLKSIIKDDLYSHILQLHNKNLSPLHLD